MLIFKDSGGQEFRAKSHIRIVQQMRQSAWVAPGKQAYMQDVANRINILDGGKSHIAVESALLFIESLVYYGWLVPILNEESLPDNAFQPVV